MQEECTRSCMARKELRRDRYTVSLLTDHTATTPKYRGKILVEKTIALVVEGIIYKTCKEIKIEIIDMAVTMDHVHLFIEYPSKYSVSFIVKKIQGGSSRILGRNFFHLERMVQRSSMGSRMLSWLCGSWMGSCGEVHRDTRLCAKGRIIMHKLSTG